jgi:uncharacterized protein (DUF2062 family)
LREWLLARLVRPVTRLLAVGVAPERLAWSLALGAALGLLPVLGVTTLLCAAAAGALRLNPVAIQLANYAVYPLQLPLVLVFVHAGAALLGAPALGLSLPELLAAFGADPLAFLQRFGRSGLHGVLAWALAAPLVAGIVYAASLPVLRTAAGRLARAGSAEDLR